MNLEEVKKHWYTFHSLNATHINWLIEQAEELEKLEQQLDDEISNDFNFDR